MESRTYKGAFGWKAEAAVNLTDTVRLCIVTMKRSNGALITSVIGSKREGDYYFYRVMQDFNKSVLSSTPTRTTQKTVEQQQQKALSMLDAIVADATNFYNKVAA